MKTKIQIKSIFGKLLFEFEKENNSVKETLTKAVIEGTNLRDANLYGANLRDANLIGANLIDANLIGANLIGANLIDANLRGANLRDANLYGADLTGADLRYANLIGANLIGANLDFNSLPFQQTRILPEGDIIGYKKCQNNIIVKLLIPSTAKRSQAFGRKCRAEFAKVIEIIGADKATSTHDGSFTYKVGDEVIPKNGWDDNWQNECAPGIHFFITKAEAENY